MCERKKISAAIITFNEEKNIAGCIKNVRGICDEIVIVDSLSKDNTVKIAQELGAKVVSEKYLGDGPQKQLATSLTTNNWVLSIDADERLDKDAIKEIKGLALDDETIGYSFKRKNYVGERWLNVSDFYPDRKVRLFNKLQSKYADKKGHSYVQCQKEVELNVNILHYAYENYSHWIRKYNFLSSRDAWVKKNKSISGFSILVHSFWAFFKKYILRGGVFQGMDGLTVSLFSAFFNYVKYVKVKEIQEIGKNKNHSFDPGKYR